MIRRHRPTPVASASDSDLALSADNRQRRGKSSTAANAFVISIFLLLAIWLISAHNTLSSAEDQLLHFMRTQAEPQKKIGGRVFVCITGQTQRLILRKKIETLLEPMRKDGFMPDIALILTDKQSQYTNPVKGINQPEFKEYTQVHKYLQDRNFSVVTNGPTTQSESPDIHHEYLSRMDRANAKPEYQQKRVANHARQFESLSECYTVMQQAMRVNHDDNNSSSTMSTLSSSSSSPYEFALRIRDDTAFNESFSVLPLLPLPSRTVLGSDCRAHGGMNDRFHLFPMDAAQDYFTLPLLKFRDKSHTLHPQVSNPESYLYYTYREAGHLQIINTPQLRGLVRYITDDQGNEVPAFREHVLFCPSDTKPSYIRRMVDRLFQWLHNLLFVHSSRDSSNEGSVT